MKKETKILLFIFVLVVIVIAFFLHKQQDNTLQIKNVLQKEIPRKSAVKSFAIVDLKIKDGFAKATIKPLDVQTDNAWVILQKKDTEWQIVWGPGTDINPDDQIYKIIPKDL